jgi:ADP-ribose pyrophosphatase YjhB (NUDIX family)
MQTKPHIGNLVLVTANLGSEILLLHKLPENDADRLRTRKRVGIDCWGPPGGGNEAIDLTEVHAARRETMQETGLEFPIEAFRKIGMLEGFVQADTPTPELAWIVHIYAVRAWPGMQTRVRIDPGEHDGFGWFTIGDIPWGKMIEADREWLPELLKGKPLSIRVGFEGETEKVLWCHMDQADFRG